MTYAIGVDPDTTNTGVAVVELGNPPQVRAVYCIKQRGKKDRQATLAMVDHVRTFFSKCDELLPDEKLVSGIAVEGQEIYSNKGGRGTKNPRSILWLAPISGAWLTVMHFVYPYACLLFPSPAGWKGQVPKQIHHLRLGKKLGWKMVTVGTKEKGYAYPEDPPKMIGTDTPEALAPFVQNINQGDWKHVMDAIGMAIWAGEQAAKEEKKREDMGVDPAPASNED